MRRKVLLQNGAFLIFDYAAGLWRCAFYRKRYKGESGATPSPELWAAMARAGMVPLVRRETYCRFTVTATTLCLAITDALRAGEKFEWYDDVLTYLEGCDWGKAALDWRG